MQLQVLVVTPIYATNKNNRQAQLLQTIHWVKEQTHQNRVHVLVDDGSTDDTPELLETLADHHQHLRVYHKANGGSSDAVNYGVNQALKEFNPSYVTIHHSDDLMLPHSLEVRVDAAKKTASPFIYTDEVIFDEKNKVTGTWRAPGIRDGKQLYQHLHCHSIPYPTMMWETGFFVNDVGMYDKHITSAEDWDIAWRTAEQLSKNCLEAAVEHEVTIAYRLHENNLGLQNRRDGTKRRCHKMIIQKHLSGREYLQLYMQRFLLSEMRNTILSFGARKVHHWMRNLRGKNSIVALPPYTGKFVEHAMQVDYSYLTQQIAVR